MNFNKKVVRAFYDYREDLNGELGPVAAIWRLIYRSKTESPGYMLYLETQVKKSVVNVQTIKGLHDVLREVINNTLYEDGWTWKNIAHLFYCLHLIDQHGEFWVVDKRKFREVAIFLVGETLKSIVTEADWKSIPIITIMDESPTQEFSWITLFSGAVIGYLICYINSK